MRVLVTRGAGFIGFPYGPRARPAAVLPSFVRKALAGEPLTIAGDGSQSRRFVYVEDLAEGIVAALRPQAVQRTYNLVGEEDTTERQIADAVRDPGVRRYVSWHMLDAEAIDVT